MKPSLTRRTRNRRVSAQNEGGAFFSKEANEHSFLSSPVAEPFFAAASPAVQRKCEKCEEEKESHKPMEKKKEDDKKLQRKEMTVPASVTATASISTAIGSTSQTLPSHLAYQLGSRMGADFSDTKIHVGSSASKSAKAIHAKAYTLGNHIVFGEGQFKPETSEGKRLLAHELAHVVQQRQGKALYRMGEENTGPATEESATEEQPAATFVTGELQYENTTHFANCDGISVQGRTNANYSHSFSSAGNPTRGENCTGCSGAQCINDTGTITSTFNANPTVSLPAVPAGLSECEANAVRTFINGTLAAHEQQHVAAFNTYIGTETTPYTYAGCRTGLNAFIRGRHNSIEASRRAGSDALSAALDANGANNFTITCNCPDPSESTESE